MATCCTTLVGGSDGCCNNSTAYMQSIVFLAAAGFAHPHTLRNSFNLHPCTAGSIDPVVCSSIIHIYIVAVE